MGRHLSVFVPWLAAWYDIDRCSTPVLCLGQEISPARRYCVPPHSWRVQGREIGPPILGGTVFPLTLGGCRSADDRSAKFRLDSSGPGPRGRDGGTWSLVPLGVVYCLCRAGSWGIGLEGPTVVYHVIL